MKRPHLRHLMALVAALAVACGLVSKLVRLDSFPWWYAWVLASAIGLYILAATTFGGVIHGIESTATHIHRRFLHGSRPIEPPAVDLYEPCETMIAESRRGRERRDAEWVSSLEDLSRTDGFCRSLLGEASVRLDAVRK